MNQALIAPCSPQQRWLAEQLSIPQPANVLGALAANDLPPTSNVEQYFRVEPVHYRLATDHIVLAQSGFSDLTLAQSQALIDSLAPLAEHFNLSIFIAPSGRWYLRWDASELATSTSQAAAGRNIDIYLPRNTQSSATDNARLWRRIATEIEMTWFNHPVNEARQNERKLPVNSLWLESRCSASKQPAGKSHALTDDPAHADLFSCVGLKRIDLFDPSHPTIIEHNSLKNARGEANAWDWIQAWQALQQPLLTQLQAAHASGLGLEIVCFGEAQQKSWQIKPKTIWQRLSKVGGSFAVSNLSESIQ